MYIAGEPGSLSENKPRFRWNQKLNGSYIVSIVNQTT
jgi:hypothetical protein